ncbi:MAG: hypothetical protein Q8P41_27110 [Pseudomonadota bacterium]|nr:hypothetical protein [Pseudomonadota bacterium]
MSRLPILVLGLAFATPTLADTTSLTTRGDYVSASYYSYGGGCAATYVTVSAYENVDHSSGSGAPTAAATAYAYVGNYDYCTGTFSYYYGTLDNVSLSAGGATGSLSGSGTLYDYYSGAALAVTVSATSGSEDGAYSGTSNSHSSTPGVTYHFRSHGSWSYGTATIVLNGTTYTQAGGGSFGRSSSGQLTITEN